LTAQGNDRREEIEGRRSPVTRKRVWVECDEVSYVMEQPQKTDEGEVR
jgi:hypothetical protein